MQKTLIIYSTVDGHTIKICSRMKDIIEQQGQSVTLESLDTVNDKALDTFDTIIIGASIRYGKHRPQVFEFINNNIELLERKENGFFTVNLVARKPEKNTPETNPYIKKFLTLTPWKPKFVGVFAGKVDYQKYGFLDRNIIRFIMLMTKGPTDPTACIEYTDWDKVDHFAKRISGAA